MAYKKTKRQEAPAAEYAPFTWVQTSGQDVVKDAKFVLLMPKLEQRQHELWRLGTLHGRYYAHQVQDKVLEMWGLRDLLRAENPMRPLEDAVNFINSMKESHEAATLHHAVI